MARFRAAAIFLPWSPCFVSPVCLLAFLICSPRSTCFPPHASFGAASLSFFSLLLALFPPHASFFRLVRPPAIVGALPGEKRPFCPLPRVRASCARAFRVSNNCLHLFTQCAQLLDMECFAVKANCRVLRFTF